MGESRKRRRRPPVVIEDQQEDKSTQMSNSEVSGVNGSGCIGIIIAIIAIFILLGSCSSSGGGGGGKCVGCGIQTSYKYQPGQGWWCYSCTH